MVERVKLGIEGVFGTGQEVWSVGLNFGPAGGNPLPSTAAQLDAWLAACNTVLQSVATTNTLRQWLTTNASITKLSAYHYPASGPSDAVSEAPVSPVVVGVGSATNPWSCARVVSLRTGVSGRSFRGRFYWPDLSTVTNSSGRVSASTASATLIGGVLAGLENAMPSGTAGSLGVYSAVRNVVTLVTQLQLGDVMDTQRRRRQDLAETYATVGYTG